MTRCTVCLTTHRHQPFDCTTPADSRPAEPDPWPEALAELARRDPETLTDQQAGWLLAYWFDGYLAPAAQHAWDARPVATGSHVGEVGTRWEGDVTVESVTSLGTGEYGDRFLCKLRTKSDNALLVWFTGENLAFEPGEERTIRAGVKAHDEYGGEKQTVVQRVTVPKPKVPKARKTK